MHSALWPSQKKMRNVTCGLFVDLSPQLLSARKPNRASPAVGVHVPIRSLRHLAPRTAETRLA